MSNIIIIHGAFGNPEENWFPWLKDELIKLGHNAFVPAFPTPKNQTLGEWYKVFEEYKKYVNEYSILVGHSLGCAFILNLLEKSNVKIKAAFLVAAYCKLINNDYFDTISRSFMKDFEWKKIKNNCNNFFVYHSDNDMHLPTVMAEDLSKNLDGNLKIIKNGGHLNEKSGYTKFDILLNDIKSFIEKDL